MQAIYSGKGKVSYNTGIYKKSTENKMDYEQLRSPLFSVLLSLFYYWT